MTATNCSSFAFEISPLLCRSGVIGMACCPGTLLATGAIRDQSLRLDMDIATIMEWGASTVVTLVESRELNWLRVQNLPNVIQEAGLDWIHLPIQDGMAPNAEFDKNWRKVGPRLLAQLDTGENILLHCVAGYGRTGTIAAKILIASGLNAQNAIERVRKTRPGTIENRIQEDYLFAVTKAGRLKSK
jgi:protein-tyrosine phosphatase